MTHTLIIAGWTPARLHEWDGRHWSSRSRLKRADRAVVALAARVHGIPPAAGPRRVGLHLAGWPRGRLPDPDGFWKSTLDALVSAGLLVDDAPRWCALGPVTLERSAARRAVLTLEDLDHAWTPGDAADTPPTDGPAPD